MSSFKIHLGFMLFCFIGYIPRWWFGGDFFCHAAKMDRIGMDAKFRITHTVKMQTITIQHSAGENQTVSVTV